MSFKPIKYLLPSAITLIRLLAAPLFFYVFLNSSCILAILVFVLAALTDILDGAMARRLGATSNTGAYFDATVDFILIVVVFVAFFQRAWYGLPILMLIMLPFIGFVWTSGIKKPVYDPVGKYLGAFLMIMIVLTLLIPYPIVRKILTYILLSLSMFSMISRMRYLSREAEVV